MKENYFPNYFILEMLIQYAKRINSPTNFPIKRAREMKILANREKKKNFTPVATVTLLFSLKIQFF